jgi:hypothetical protein
MHDTTVRGGSGDVAGHSVSPLLARTQVSGDDAASPERLFGGRFWALYASDSSEGEEEENVHEFSGLRDDVSWRYLY